LTYDGSETVCTCLSKPWETGKRGLLKEVDSGNWYPLLFGLIARKITGRAEKVKKDIY